MVFTIMLVVGLVGACFIQRKDAAHRGKDRQKDRGLFCLSFPWCVVPFCCMKWLSQLPEVRNHCWEEPVGDSALKELLGNSSTSSVVPGTGFCSKKLHSFKPAVCTVREQWWSSKWLAQFV